MTEEKPTPIGELVGGRYRLESELGRGGMATVYRATDEALGRTVAIKLFRRGLADDDDMQRQQDEVRLLASLNHPGLVTLFDAAADAAGAGEDAYLVMELVTGQDLRTRLDRGPLPSTEAALIGRHLADALAYIHSRGVIHRDVKPGNILLPERDVDHTGPLAKLADFGIARIVDGARLTATGTIVGTAGYFSPEQALGEPLTPASDVYSLGLVLLESITGVRAFPGSAAESIVARLSRDPEIPDTVDEAWGLLIRRMTARTADARPAAGEVSAALGAIAAGLTDVGVDTVTLPTVAGAPRDADATATEDDTEDATLRYGVTQARHASTSAAGAPGAAAAAFAAAPTEAFAAATPPTPEPEPEPDAAAPARDAPAGTRGRVPRLPRLPRRRVVIAGAVTLAVAAVVAVAAMSAGTQPGTSSTPPSAPVSSDPASGDPASGYPAVDGDLGTHLEQLQRTVAE